MTDKFGIELKPGDIVAVTSMSKINLPPYIGVITGFTPQRLKLTVIYMFGADISLLKETSNPHNFIKVNEEQINSLKRKVINLRIDYKFSVNSKVKEENDVNNIFNEILEISNKIKEEIR
jgi:hypothetical protein